jgi:hypothetical protein
MFSVAFLCRLPTDGAKLTDLNRLMKCSIFPRRGSIKLARVRPHVLSLLDSARLPAPGVGRPHPTY